MHPDSLPEGCLVYSIGCTGCVIGIVHLPGFGTGNCFAGSLKIFEFWFNIMNLFFMKILWYLLCGWIIGGRIFYLFFFML